jgi:hypothetical protein
MSAESTVAPVHEINRLHAEVLRRTEESKTALHAALAAAWHAGQLLVVEKKRVRKTMGGGGWFLWLERYFQGSRRTAQNYMRLAQNVADIGSLTGMSLRQVYIRLGISTEPKSRRDAVAVTTLPPHIRLANRLLATLRTSVQSYAGTEQREAYCQDLRALYDQLRTIFDNDAANITPRLRSN